MTAARSGLRSASGGAVFDVGRKSADHQGP